MTLTYWQLALVVAAAILIGVAIGGTLVGIFVYRYWPAASAAAAASIAATPPPAPTINVPVHMTVQTGPSGGDGPTASLPTDNPAPPAER